MNPIYMVRADLTQDELELAMRPSGIVMVRGGVPDVQIIGYAPNHFPLGWDERDAKI